MGALLPSPADQQIVAKLFKRFSGANLDALRNLQEDLFDHHHSLHRVSHRLGIWPDVDLLRPGHQVEKKRWYWLLSSNSKKALHHGNKQDIKNALKKAITGPYEAVIFNAVHDDGSHGTRASDPYKLEVTESGAHAPEGKLHMVLTLYCFQEIDPTETGSGTNPSADPTQPDAGVNEGAIPPAT